MDTAAPVQAAEEYDTQSYDAEVVKRVEVAPGTWVCAHADGSVSLKFQVGSQAARDWAAAFGEMADEAESQEPAEAEPVAAAAGHDVTPGHDELHHYWTRSPEGLAKWAESPTPWTTLYHHLLKYAPSPEAAKRWASAWFIEVMHFASGSDLNRVTHGRPPRGRLVGPG